MRIRDGLRQLLHRFERALTRVEDQGVRVEQGVDNVVDQLTRLNEAVYSLRSDVLDRDSKREQELRLLRQDVGMLKKKLEERPAVSH